MSLTNVQLETLAEKMGINLARVCFKNELHEESLVYNAGYVVNMEDEIDEEEKGVPAAPSPICNKLSCGAPPLLAHPAVARTLVDDAFERRAGDPVRLLGLRASHLNGLCGRIIQWFPDLERYGIVLAGSLESIKVKACNLVPCSGDEDEVCSACLETVYLTSVPACGCRPGCSPLDVAVFSAVALLRGRSSS